jgi:hypothetical protein
MPFRWQPTANRWRDETSGRFLGNRQVVALRDEAVAAAGRDARSLAERAVRGEVAPDAFRAGMREVSRNAHTANYLLGRGGVNAMQASDFRTLATSLRTEFGHIDRFAWDVEAGTLSEAQAAARAELYAGAGVRSYEQGVASAWGVEAELPGYPADGGTQCLSRCRCSWRLNPTEHGIAATWVLGGADPCDGCRQRAAAWNPVVVMPTAAPTEPVRLSVVRRMTA